MSLKRWAARRDSNEREIVAALRKVGASVAHISEKGAPDLLVCLHGRVTLLEVKRAKAVGQTAGRATVAQDKRSLEGWPIVTVRTVDDGLRAVGAIR